MSTKFIVRVEFQSTHVIEIDEEDAATAKEAEQQGIEQALQQVTPYGVDIETLKVSKSKAKQQPA